MVYDDNHVNYGVKVDGVLFLLISTEGTGTGSVPPRPYKI